MTAPPMYILSITLFILALTVALGLRLVLTLPLVVASLGLLVLIPVAKHSNKSKYLLINVGFTMLLSGIAFTIVNLVSTMNYKKPYKRVYVADYGTPKAKGAWVSGASEPLGYRYKTGLKPIRSKLIDEDSKFVIYDVTYSFQGNGLRTTTSPTVAHLLGKQALFLGGSFTFGEGLDDESTLPSLFSHETGWSSINAGMHGYGTHQAYETLRNPVLYAKTVNHKKVDLIVYRVMDDHVNRAAGKSDWDRYGPCFQVSRNNAIDYQGTFESCKIRPSLSSGARAFLSILMKTKEPLTRSLLENTEQIIFRNYDERRQLALITEMNQLALSKGAKFIVLNETISPPTEDMQNAKSRQCNLLHRMIDLGSKLRANGIDVIDFHQIVSHAICSSGSLAIPRDGHPSRFANSLAAKSLARFTR